MRDNEQKRIGNKMTYVQKKTKYEKRFTSTTKPKENWKDWEKNFYESVESDSIEGSGDVF